jgi:hypothetical protein
MAKAKYPHKTLYKLLAADEDISASDFDVLSGVTASAAELNYADTSAPGTVTASKAMVVDANSAILGWRRKVTADADGGPLTAATSNGVYTNEGAEGEATFILPASAVGMEYYFYVLEAQELRIDPNGTETIGLPSSGAQQAAGKYITANAAGEYVHILCATAGQWETLDYRGTWDVESA